MSQCGQGWGLSGSSLPMWRFQGKRSSPSSFSCPGEMANHPQNSAFPKVSRYLLAEVYPLAKVYSTAQLSQRIQVHPEIQETQCGSPWDSSWEALPRVSRLSGCVISGINTAVFVSPSSAADRAAAWPAACSWASHLGTDAIRVWRTHPSQRPPGAAPQADLSGDQLGAPGAAGEETPEIQVLQSQEGKRVWRNL